MSFRSIGIDLGITSLHKAVILGSEGRQIGKVISFDSSLEGYDRLLEASLLGEDTQSKDTQPKLKFIMEPTSTSWIGLSAYLISQGHEVYLIKPQKSADLRRFYHRHIKSDRIDAKAIAKLPIVDPDGLNPLEMSDPNIYSLYRLSLERDRLARENEGDKKRLKTIFNMVIPKLFQAMGSWQFSLGAKALVREYANPFKVIELELNGLKEFMEKHAHGSLAPELPQRVFDACQSACQLYGQLQAEGQIPFDYEQIQREVRRKLDIIQYRQEQIKEIEKEMKGYYAKVDPQEALLSVKGFGLVIASALIGALGNIGRFRNAKAIVSYCGLAPRKKQSGNTDRQGMPLTKAGKRIVKKYLHLGGEVARQWDPQLANIYFRLRKAGKPHNKAMGAVSAHMATRAYAVLKKVYQTEQGQAKGKDVQKVRYELRDPDGKAISSKKAKEMIQQKYQLPKTQRAKQAGLEKKQVEPEKEGNPALDQIQQDPRKKEKNFGAAERKENKAAQPDSSCRLARQSKTPQSGSSGSLEQLATLENIVKQKECQEGVKEFLLQNQNVFESTDNILAWLDKGANDRDLRETILANIALYRKKILIRGEGSGKSALVRKP
jgi:transposase